MARAADFDSIGIGLPREWATLPIEQQGFDRFCADLRARWRGDPDWNRTTERRAELLLARIRAEMRRVNIRFAAMYVESAPERAGDEDAETLLAACTFATYTQADLQTSLRLTYPNLLAAFSVRRKTTPEDRRITNLEPPCQHELRIGRSVRLRRLIELRHTPMAEADRLFSESFVVPVGDDATTCGVMQFVTPNLQLARGFSGLFLAIAESVTLYTPEQETEVALLR